MLQNKDTFKGASTAKQSYFIIRRQTDIIHYNKVNVKDYSQRTTPGYLKRLSGRKQMRHSRAASAEGVFDGNDTKKKNMIGISRLDVHNLNSNSKRSGNFSDDGHPTDMSHN